MTEDELSKKIVQAAFEVHRTLGPGLLESTYEACMVYELSKMGLTVEAQKALSVEYKNVKLEAGYRIDLFVEKKVIVEIKCVEKLTDVHLAQILTYLKLSRCKLGLLINFNTRLIKNGIKRVVNNL
jgi:GxxExxY protein